MAKKKNVGRMARAKGARGEREVASLFSARGFSAKRGCQHKGGFDSPDIVVDALHRAFHFEVKWVEAFNMWSAMAQAERDGGNKCPIVVHKKNGKQWVAIMDLNRLIDMFQMLYDRVDWANQLVAKTGEGEHLL